MPVVTSEMLTDKNSWCLIPNELAEELVHRGYIKLTEPRLIPQDINPHLEPKMSRVQIPEGCFVEITHKGKEHSARGEEGDWVVGVRVHPADGEPYSSLGIISDVAMQKMANLFENRTVNFHNHKI
jgi:hypothetical protein